jgi:hypothetical protein
MRTDLLNPFSLSILVALSACAPNTQTAAIPPAPIRGFWPEWAFEPRYQCQGELAVDDLERLLPRARLALQVPGIQAVEVDPTRRCLVITVEDIETGRFTELLMRGVAVPRRAVLLQLAMQ